jgi:hypothetical protein
MITKLPVLGFSLMTALSAPALAQAHEECGGKPHAPASYGGPRESGPRESGQRDKGRRSAPRDIVLTHSDINRDGWVTLDEALSHGRSAFRRSDRDNNQVLSRREMDRSEISRHDRDRDGRMSFREHQWAVGEHFARLDQNRDGYLTRYELDERSGSPPVRSAGWWR